LHGESRDKIAAKICDFLVANYSTEEVAEAVKNAYGQCQGKDVFVGDFCGFLPKGAYVIEQGINTPHEQPEHGPDGETYKVYVEFTYHSRSFAYLFSAVQAFPGNPVTLKEVFLHEEKNGSYKKIADLKW
jgi:hypothetical protein